jgi:hypothetical protein
MHDRVTGSANRHSAFLNESFIRTFGSSFGRPDAVRESLGIESLIGAIVGRVNSHVEPRRPPVAVG